MNTNFNANKSINNKAKSIQSKDENSHIKQLLIDYYINKTMSLDDVGKINRFFQVFMNHDRQFRQLKYFLKI
jgi:hypothetical protein